jgi:hypothetical protein
MPGSGNEPRSRSPDDHHRAHIGKNRIGFGKGRNDDARFGRRCLPDEEHDGLWRLDRSQQIECLPELMRAGL